MKIEDKKALNKSASRGNFSENPEETDETPEEAEAPEDENGTHPMLAFRWDIIQPPNRGGNSIKERQNETWSGPQLYAGTENDCQKPETARAEGMGYEATQNEGDKTSFFGPLFDWEEIASCRKDWIGPRIPTVPESPQGVNIDENIRLANQKGLINFGWFYNKVRNHGDWDFKQLDSKPNIQSKYEDFGNFHYGAVASALGLPPEIILRGGGFAANRADTTPAIYKDSIKGRFWGEAPYGDDLKDRRMIIEGIKYYYRKFGNSKEP